MCRSIKQLRGQEPTAEDVEAAALQFERKVSGYLKPSQTTTVTFETAVGEISEATERLLGSLIGPRRSN